LKCQSAAAAARELAMAALTAQVQLIAAALTQQVDSALDPSEGTCLAHGGPRG